VDQAGSAEAKEERFGGLGGQHGGAGWTRTSDNAIMSRALYHLSYGTVDRRCARRAHSWRRRARRAHFPRDPIAPPVPAPSACASWSVAFPAPPASSCSQLSVRLRASRSLMQGTGRPSSVVASICCGGRIRTDDLRVMSPTSCRCSTPRAKLYRRLAGQPGAGVRGLVLRPALRASGREAPSPGRPARSRERTR
jgi:hypothetical protein